MTREGKVMKELIVKYQKQLNWSPQFQILSSTLKKKFCLFNGNVASKKWFNNYNHWMSFKENKQIKKTTANFNPLLFLDRLST